MSKTSPAPDQLPTLLLSLDDRSSRGFHDRHLLTGARLGSAYIINQPDVVAEEFDGEFVVLDLGKGIYFSFGGSGNLLWELLMAGTSPETVVRIMEQGPARPHAEAAASFYDRVAREGLVRRSGEASEPDEGALVRITEIRAAPVIEVFDELADLILADPIHGADVQAGWPAAKPNTP